MAPEGGVEFFDSRLGKSFDLPVDSLMVYTFFRYKKVPLSGGDPLEQPDSALIRLTDEVEIHNWGYLNEDQVIWKNLNEGEKHLTSRKLSMLNWKFLIYRAGKYGHW